MCRPDRNRQFPSLNPVESDVLVEWVNFPLFILGRDLEPRRPIGWANCRCRSDVLPALLTSAPLSYRLSSNPPPPRYPTLLNRDPQALMENGISLRIDGALLAVRDVHRLRARIHDIDVWHRQA